MALRGIGAAQDFVAWAESANRRKWLKRIELAGFLMS